MALSGFRIVGGISGTGVMTNLTAIRSNWVSVDDAVTPYVFTKITNNVEPGVSNIQNKNELKTLGYCSIQITNL